MTNEPLSYNEASKLAKSFPGEIFHWSQRGVSGSCWTTPEGTAEYYPVINTGDSDE